MAHRDWAVLVSISCISLCIPRGARFYASFPRARLCLWPFYPYLHTHMRCNEQVFSPEQLVVVPDGPLRTRSWEEVQVGTTCVNGGVHL